MRTLAPHACLSRKTSRTFRIDNLSAGIATPTRHESHATDHWIVADALDAPRDCPASIKITVWLASESVSAFRWNNCPHSLGIRMLHQLRRKLFDESYSNSPTQLDNLFRSKASLVQIGTGASHGRVFASPIP